MSRPASDQKQRDEALDTQRSFIVQAPAGSGKTELLTLRYMRLLATVAEPEEVLAITFTRKAAAEMRARVIESLNEAQQLRREHSRDSLEFDDERHPVSDGLKRKNFFIANAVVERDKERQWNLERNPGRLRIQTIDSFNIYLANQLPIASRIGGDLSVTTETAPVFNAAVRNTLALLDTPGADSEHLVSLYQHLDNNPAAIEKLLLNMINKRDQWLDYLPTLFDDSGNAQIELMLHVDELAEELLEPLFEAMQEFSEQLLAINNYAHTNWPLETAGRPELLHDLPSPDAEGLPGWNALCNLLLTQKNELRKSLNASLGFPPKSALKGDALALGEEKKALHKTLVSALGEAPAEVLELLASVRALPTRETISQQWPLLSALAHTLRLLNRQLILEFTRRGIIDHTQAANAAFSALRTLHSPTEFALALDNTLSHILIDEFQDTSERQLALLEELIEGWTPGDGKTLFLVGDAMQSCYNFRNANVGVYLKVRSAGIAHFKPETLMLRMNFRSQENLIERINAVFSTAFPTKENIARGAVCYSYSEAGQEAIQQQPLQADWVCYDDSDNKTSARKLEAELLVQRINALRVEEPNCSIAVLARTRNHFRDVIAELRQQEIAWVATDLDRLGSLAVISDLLSLVRALSNTADDLAWFAVLRAPWCGLDSVDLLAVRESEAASPVWQSLSALVDKPHNEQSLLSAEGYKRLCGLHEALSAAMWLRRQSPISEITRAAWELLQGPNLITSSDEQAAAKFFFDQLSLAEEHFVIADLDAFSKRIQESFTSVQAEQSDKTSPPVQLMTIHKSKGLQFDHVLIPQLGGKGNPDDKNLIELHERINQGGESRLLIAPVPRKSSTTTAETEAHEKLYKYIREEKRLKGEYEETRLVYIAMTRARYSVGLFSTLLYKDSDNETQGPKPINQSLLARIWQPLKEAGVQENSHYLPKIQDTAANKSPSARHAPTTIRRLSKPLTLTAAQRHALEEQMESRTDLLIEEQEIVTGSEQLEAERQRRLRQFQGTLCHEFFEAYTLQPMAAERALAALEPRWQRQLERLGATSDEARASSRKACQQLHRAVTGDHAWIFDPEADGASELHLARSAKQGSEEFHSHYAVDRTVMRNGERWIIDYKTAQQPEGFTTEQFINAQKNEHEEKLHLYATLMAEAGQPAQRLGLYLLEIDRLVEL